MTSLLLIVLSGIIFTLVKVNGHSWLACTDYAEKNAGTWNPSKCRGFPRRAHQKANKFNTFGSDTGLYKIFLFLEGQIQHQTAYPDAPVHVFAIRYT